MSEQNKVAKIKEMRKNAKHGEFFFSKFQIENGEERKSPVFVISADGNDRDDVIVCKCTGQPSKTIFDVPVKLKKETCVRTNKIYTINREQLLFKIPQEATEDEYMNIMDKLKQTLNMIE